MKIDLIISPISEGETTARWGVYDGENEFAVELPKDASEWELIEAILDRREALSGRIEVRP